MSEILWRTGVAWIAGMGLSVFPAAVSVRPVAVAVPAERTRQHRSAGSGRVATGSRMSVAAVCIPRILHPWGLLEAAVAPVAAQRDCWGSAAHRILQTGWIAHIQSAEVAGIQSAEAADTQSAEAADIAAGTRSAEGRTLAVVVVGSPFAGTASRVAALGLVAPSVVGSVRWIRKNPSSPQEGAFAAGARWTRAWGQPKGR